MKRLQFSSLFTTDIIKASYTWLQVRGAPAQWPDNCTTAMFCAKSSSDCRLRCPVLSFCQ